MSPSPSPLRLIGLVAISPPPPTRLTPDSRLDLWERRLKASSKQIRKRAAELVPKGLRTPKGSMVVLDESDGDSTASGKLTKRAARHKQDVERELSRLKVNIADRVNRLSASWASDKVVRTREKFCESESGRDSCEEEGGEGNRRKEGGMSRVEQWHH